MPRIDGTLATPLADRRSGREMVRLMVAMNTVDTIYRPLILSLDDGYADEFGHTAAKGDRVVMLSLLINAIKEAMEVFREVESIADELFGYIRLEPVYADYVDFKRMTDRKDPASIYSRLIEPVQGSLAFQCDRVATESTLAAMAPVPGTLQTHHESAHGRAVSRFPLADEIFARTLLGVTTPQQLRAAIMEIQDFTEIFKRVAEHLIALFLRALGCRTIEAD